MADTDVKQDAPAAGQEPQPQKPEPKLRKITDPAEIARRQRILAQIEELREQVRMENPDITEEEAEAVADQLTRAAIQSLIDKGRIKYGR